MLNKILGDSNLDYLANLLIGSFLPKSNLADGSGQHYVKQTDNYTRQRTYATSLNIVCRQLPTKANPFDI